MVFFYVHFLLPNPVWYVYIVICSSEIQFIKLYIEINFKPAGFCLLHAQFNLTLLSRRQMQKKKSEIGKFPVLDVTIHLMRLVLSLRY